VLLGSRYGLKSKYLTHYWSSGITFQQIWKDFALVTLITPGDYQKAAGEEVSDERRSNLTSLFYKRAASLRSPLALIPHYIKIVHLRLVERKKPFQVHVYIALMG